MPCIIPSPRGRTKPSKRLSPSFATPNRIIGMSATVSNLGPHQFAYNPSVKLSLGETPFFLNQCRHPTLPVAAVEDFTENLQNQILEARDHICRETRAKHLKQGMRPSKLKVGDLDLLSTEHYNLQLPSQKLVAGTPQGVGNQRTQHCLSGDPTTLCQTHPAAECGEPEALSPLPS